VSLYIGYYGSQRQGDTIHSPQNCLPGAGWQPVEGGRVPLDVDGRRVTVNRYVIQKGLDRQVVLYWYQGRGRVVANEYANKLWLMLDAARLHRSDGALVRVVAPVLRSPGGSLAAADDAAAAFTRTIFPRLPAHLP
jgi:EpsI family protein